LTLKAASFSADLAIQAVSINATGGSFSEEYNFASGAAAFLLSNPITSNAIGSGVSLNSNGFDYDVAKGLAGGLIGGAIGKAFDPLSKYLAKQPTINLQSMYGEVTQLPNLLGVSVGLGVGLFTESTKAVANEVIDSTSNNKEENK